MKNRFSLAAFALLLPISALTLSGCTMDSPGTNATTASTEPLALPAIEGTIMGGESPIAGSAITLWETDPANGGYASSTAVSLGTATGSTPGGNFGFTTGYTCTPGEFVYVTSTGGDTSNGSASPVINNNLVMVAALGNCSNFANATAQGKVRITVNEVSTIAAAYALDGFMTVSGGSSGTQKVYIGAPAKNNATTGACMGLGTAMTCSSAGLSHAFANAANLVDAVHYDGTQPSGTARTTVPSNPYSSVPTALINTLANIMQYCTNSAGGAAGDGSACGLLFTDATPTGSSSTAPADTLTAFMNVARQPYLNVGSSCTGTTGGLFCLASGFASFAPSLTAAPHDWSVAVAYTGVTAPVTISNYTYSSGTATFTTSANTFTAGTVTSLSGFPYSTFLNNQSVTVLAAGLSSTQFEATVTLPSTAISAYSISNNVATFTTAANVFAPGETVTLAGFTTGTFFNGQSFKILSETSTQITVAYNNGGTAVASTTDAGTATPVPNTGTTNTEAGSTTAGTFGSPQYLVLDANDNVYAETGNLYTATAQGISGLTANGGLLSWNIPYSPAYCTIGSMATDVVGNVWLTVEASSTSTCAYTIDGFSTATGALTTVMYGTSGNVCNQASPTSSNCPGFPSATTTYDTTHGIPSQPKAIAFDRFNNLWWGRFASSTCAACIVQMPYTSGSPGTYGTAITENASLLLNNNMIIDANDNVWIANSSTTSGTAGKLYEVYNTGPAGAPTYSTTGYLTFTQASYNNGDLGIDSAGNLWTASNLATQEVTVSGSGTSTTLTAVTPTIVTTASYPHSGEVDGGETYWYPSQATSGSLFLQLTPLSPLYNSTTSSKNINLLRPCYVPANSSTCDAAMIINNIQYYISGDAKMVQVDSAGAVWVAAGVSSGLPSGYILQVLGPGTPTWPEYEYGVFGTKPQ